jgi:hypothetical protein
MPNLSGFFAEGQPHFMFIANILSSVRQGGARY